MKSIHFKLSILLLAFLNVINLSGCSSNVEKIVEEFVPTVVYTPYSAEDCIDKNKDSIISDFKECNFINISEIELSDLDLSESDKLGTITFVSINGVSDFAVGTEFMNTSKIVVKYHSYKKIKTPVSYQDAKITDLDTLIDLFSENGFTNIKVEEVYDIDPDDTDIGFENNVSINGSSFFDKEKEFPLDATVKIVAHKPYNKYDLKVSVDFIPNLLFNKYDVELKVDDSKETLSHGEDADFAYRFKEGEYEITFKSAENKNAKETFTVKLDGNTEISYQLSCYTDEIKVETKYYESDSELKDNETRTPLSDWDCKYDNYKDVEKLFKDAGFTNISTEIQYDIVWGWTQEGEVEKVSINGNADFNKGDIFSKDSKIVITYHLKEEDDPNKLTETTIKEEKENESSTLFNEAKAVFYSTNDYETAKRGNSGKFSYRYNPGSYYIYWIIDFDEGYAYSFIDGDGSGTCEKVKIMSGDLNDKIIVTYHDGGTEWSYGLHFKYVNHPEVLIMQDQNGFEYKFKTTDIDDALSIRNKLKIIEY